MISAQQKPLLANLPFLGLLAANTILGAALPLLIILGGLAGLALAPSPALATLPPSIQIFAGFVVTGPFSLLMGRQGRRFGFVVGAVTAMIGGALGVLALFWSSFALLCLAHAFTGAALACYLYFRFAAAEVVAPQWQPVAISLMLTSGLIAALIGPEIFIRTKDSFAQVPLAGAYASIVVLSLVGVLPLAFVKLPPPASAGGRAGLDRGALVLVLRSRPVFAAIVIGAVSQGIMVLLMAPTPLAMTAHGHSDVLASDVVRWHVVAMFAPSFVTGFLIKRFGTVPIVATGLIFLICAAAVAASGLSLHHFYAALIVLGIGWNFSFIGATDLLARAVAAEDRAVVQGLNDTAVALASTICVFGSGAIVTGLGWSILSLSAVPILTVALVWVIAIGRQLAEA
ncbi:MFS transporter [Primorskyibacter sp. S187A]|uniref:MFS transporter n=1 Tax=Primorskyibacter sp. S187A TaxID=3415130 RepID=UPI003C7C08C0